MIQVSFVVEDVGAEWSRSISHCQETEEGKIKNIRVENILNKEVVVVVAG